MLMKNAKLIKFKPEATIVVQHMALVEIEGIAHNGKLYVPTGLPVGAGESSEEEDDDDKGTPTVTSKKAPVRTTKPDVEEEDDDDDKGTAKPVGGKKPTEKEMMEMPIDELWEMVDEIPGLRKKITAADGKNTNMKVRKALLEAWSKSKSNDDDEDEAPATTSRRGAAPEPKGGDVPKGADKLLKKFDAAEIEEDELIDGLVELGADKAATKKFVKEFVADSTAPVEDYIKKLPSLFSDSEEEDDDDDDKAASKKAPVKSSKREAIPHDELEVGDKVIVKWEDGEEYTGEVASIGRKGITIDYDDDTSDLLDEEMVVYARK